MSREQLRTVGKRTLDRDRIRTATANVGLMTLLNAIVQSHGGRITLDARKVEQMERYALQTFVDADLGTVTVIATPADVQIIDGEIPDWRGLRHRIAEWLIR